MEMRDRKLSKPSLLRKDLTLYMWFLACKAITLLWQSHDYNLKVVLSVKQKGWSWRHLRRLPSSVTSLRARCAREACSGPCAWNWVLNTSKKGVSRESLGNPFQYLTILTVNFFFSIFNGILCLISICVHYFLSCHWSPWGRLWSAFFTPSMSYLYPLLSSPKVFACPGWADPSLSLLVRQMLQALHGPSLHSLQ